MIDTAVLISALLTFRGGNNLTTLLAAGTRISFFFLAKKQNFSVDSLNSIPVKSPFPFMDTIILGYFFFQIF